MNDPPTPDWRPLVMLAWSITADAKDGKDGSGVIATLESKGIRGADLAFRRRALRNLSEHTWQGNLALLYMLAFGLVPDALLAQLWRVIGCDDEGLADKTAAELFAQAVAGGADQDRTIELRWWEGVQLIITLDHSRRRRILNQLLRELSPAAQ
ncbi:hypothetical protein JNJ66_03920 [Candidatus Saccharibacteria bacterium]|nr:hypothetical protein [Candidatus Saccharibacteria bacterium]